MGWWGSEWVGIPDSGCATWSPVAVRPLPRLAPAGGCPWGGGLRRSGALPGQAGGDTWTGSTGNNGARMRGHGGVVGRRWWWSSAVIQRARAPQSSGCRCRRGRGGTRVRKGAPATGTGVPRRRGHGLPGAGCRDEPDSCAGAAGEGAPGAGCGASASGGGCCGAPPASSVVGRGWWAGQHDGTGVGRSDPVTTFHSSGECQWLRLRRYGVTTGRGSARGSARTGVSSGSTRDRGRGSIATGRCGWAAGGVTPCGCGRARRRAGRCAGRAAVAIAGGFGRSRARA